jgi:hypothetical protein
MAIAPQNTFFEARAPYNSHDADRHLRRAVFDLLGSIRIPVAPTPSIPHFIRQNGE